jgi:hypothetical protein
MRKLNAMQAGIALWLIIFGIIWGVYFFASDAHSAERGAVFSILERAS